jgi:glycine cleavage system H protein
MRATEGLRAVVVEFQGPEYEMPQRLLPDDAQPCIWMSAGLVTYKICDRRFECDHCPLDAGLREGTLVGVHGEGRAAPRRTAGVFPEDRRYSSGHSWLKTVGPLDDGRQRLGLDAFAAAIIGHCDGVRWGVSPRTVSQDEAICHIDLGLGMLSVRAPLSGVVVDGNPLLEREPGLLVTAPYDDGWILEFRVLDVAELSGLMTAEVARNKARMDLRRFRRRIAVQLFADAQAVEQGTPDGEELIADLRQMLGGAFYLDLLQELIH